MRDTTNGASVTLSEVVKRYGDVTAVDGISLDIKPGEFVTLLGPSGSGKTTTLNLIAGFTTITSGEIRIDGAHIEQVPPHRRNIGMIFQNYALFPHMTAFENIAYPLKQRKVPRSQLKERVERALDLVGLPAIGKRHPRQLSGGQQQRVAFARAIVFDPRVLLMDEPLGALDRKLRDALQAEIKRIHRELGITFIYVTHDQEEALALSDRIGVFNDGTIEQVGTPAELYQRPQTRFVADFVGDSNVFEGVLTRHEGGTDLIWNSRSLHVSSTTCGRRGILVLRPHQIHVVDESSQQWDNVLGARLTDVAFLGASQKLTLKLELGGRVVLRRPSEDAGSEAVGDVLKVGWNANEGFVLSEEDDARQGADLVEEGPHSSARAVSEGAGSM
jgi:putative spermidine/putrescine transport system ATP-binding protein